MTPTASAPASIAARRSAPRQPADLHPRHQSSSSGPAVVEAAAESVEAASPSPSTASSSPQSAANFVAAAPESIASAARSTPAASVSVSPAT